MADLMQQAREWQSSAARTSDGRIDALLLAVRKYGAASSTLGGSPLSKRAYYDAQTRRDLAWAEIDAIAESLVEDIKNIHALRAAPEGCIPERAMMALATGWRRHAASGGRGRAVLIQCAESLEAAVIAARPQGVR